jgi:hypothetical protein
MNKQFYTVRWQQVYANWVPREPELDLTQAREVIARIMAL